MRTSSQSGRGKSSQVVWFFLLGALLPARSDDSGPFYSLAAVSAIDWENKMLRLVDATGTIDKNMQRLLAAGFSASQVEALRPQLLEIWNVELPLQLDWLARDTLNEIRKLEPKYAVRMRQARLDEALMRLGGGHEPLTPGQVASRWRKAIMQLLDDREIKEFALLNSAPALALQELTRNLSLTQDERRTLCRWQQDYHGALFQIGSDNGSHIVVRKKEALLEYWGQMRGLLGDDRFTAYLRMADVGFERMDEALKPSEGVSSSKILDLWWIRKNGELADMRMVLGSARYQLKTKAYAAASDILGPKALKIYEKADDAKWLENTHPYKSTKDTALVAEPAATLENQP